MTLPQNGFRLYTRADGVYVQAMQVDTQIIIICPDATGPDEIMTTAVQPGDYIGILVGDAAERFGQGFNALPAVEFERIWTLVEESQP